MRHTRQIALTGSILLGLVVPGWNSPRAPQQVAAHDPEADLQIQSSVLRVEFDRNLHTRVVPLLGGIAKPLVGFSASESVTGVGRSWSDFVLASAYRENVSDVFGAGERLSLSGESGELRKKISVTIYRDFPSIAVFEVEYTNEGASRIAIRGWANHQYLLNSGPASAGPAFWSYQSGSYEKRPDWV